LVYFVSSQSRQQQGADRPGVAPSGVACRTFPKDNIKISYFEADGNGRLLPLLLLPALLSIPLSSLLFDFLPI